MTICRYYQQGTCRFGDRCRFEHSDYRPDSSNRRSDNYHKSQYYDTSYSYESNSYDPSYNYRKDSYGDDSYNYKRDGTYNDRYHPNYGKYERQNETYYSARYDDKDYRYSQQKPANARNYNQYTYESPRQSRSPDRSEDGYYNSRSSKTSVDYNTSTPKSKVTFSFKDPDSAPKHKESEDLLGNEHNIFLAEVMRKDAQEWEEGKMWPFTSYSPKMNASNFPGFHDFSPEELMQEAYKSMKTNGYSSFVESVEKTLLDVKTKIKELQNPTGPLLFMIDKYRKGEFPDMDTVDGGKFLKCSSTTTEEMMAEGPQVSHNSPASSFSFKTKLEVDNAIKKSASAFSFKTASETDSAVKSSLSAFSFKIPSETSGSVKSSASAFSFKLPAEPVSTNRSFPFSAQDGPSNIYTPSNQISLQDKEQFMASTFTLGKIPTIPPAQYMCM